MTAAHETSTRHQRAFPYELRSFPVQFVDGEIPGEVAHWIQAVALGFYGNIPTPEMSKHYVETERVDARVVTGAYLNGVATPAGAWGTDYPVATYAYHRKTLNIGADGLLPVHQITAVTVRPSHRRRGILRAMMSSDLAQAKAAGLSIAALTASEATIYGRFGFGVATHECEVEVAVKGGIAFHNPAAAGHGSVEVADALMILDLHNEVFAQVHDSTYGSIGRHDMYRLTASGRGSYESMEAVKNIRAALHYNEAGVVDGYVTYKPLEDSARSVVEIVDMLAATEEAYLSLWNFLGSLDLIDCIKWNQAPVVDPLEWAMVSKRDYKRIKTEDLLWLRILDVPAALAARPYQQDGAITIDVRDSLGHASGVFRIAVVGGTASVLKVDESETAAGNEPELSLGVAELSSLYLGGVSAQTLVAAGRVHEHHAGAATRFDALFRPAQSPHCLTHF
ncbi:Predicted acetyltransferase [Arthrobacter alpinus]|uniref:Predicted acetyltransferase n=1 Tax=Arthrobacter alpinus TaxID=656366 RepID=A0A1H5J8Y4_9MICC|nr:GNAT family N-acetyltransferase [Arthrobacter alpinus]SEE48949.1 Predicted acetyltransferase [Arthrobacter alpinus]